LKVVSANVSVVQVVNCGAIAITLWLHIFDSFFDQFFFRAVVCSSSFLDRFGVIFSEFDTNRSLIVRIEMDALRNRSGQLGHYQYLLEVAPWLSLRFCGF
jgi:hypothetical protein